MQKALKMRGLQGLFRMLLLAESCAGMLGVGLDFVPRPEPAGGLL